MFPEQVQKLQGSYDIWKNHYWVSNAHQKFNIPIWRNATTTFTHSIAKKHDYKLEGLRKDTMHEGYVFIRDPRLRIKGQLDLVMRHKDTDIKTILERIENPRTDEKSKQHLDYYGHDYDVHLRTQSSFLTDFNIKYYLDLDNLKYTGDKHIDSVIDTMKSVTDGVVLNKKIEDIQLNKKDWQIIEKVYEEDYVLFKEKIK
tara:strand:- start:395 stop:994 length:600 start_codon:yes stop_codon:yes gene_type:complete